MTLFWTVLLIVYVVGFLLFGLYWMHYFGSAIPNEMDEVGAYFFGAIWPLALVPCLVIQVRRRRHPTDELQRALQRRKANEDDLLRRLRKHGTRGIIRVGSSEGAPVSPEAARYLAPPD